MNDFNYRGLTNIESEAGKRMLEIIRKRSIQIAKLTENQIVDCIMQSIISGDFIRNVYIGKEGESSQALYIPYRGIEEARSEIARLQKLLTDNKVEYNDYNKSR